MKHIEITLAIRTRYFYPVIQHSNNRTFICNSHHLERFICKR